MKVKSKFYILSEKQLRKCKRFILPSKTTSQLSAMKLVEAFSKSLDTFSWVWGGFTVDIYQNQVLREHDDLDYLTLNLHCLIREFVRLFENCGWQTRLLINGDLKIEGSGVKIHIGHVEISDKARWTHNGEQGSIWFPQEWLNKNPVEFCGIEVHVVEPEFQYVMLERPQMLNPNWHCREKDILARKYLSSLISSKRIHSQSLFEQVSDRKK